MALRSAREWVNMLFHRTQRIRRSTIKPYFRTQINAAEVGITLHAKTMRGKFLFSKAFEAMETFYKKQWTILQTKRLHHEIHHLITSTEKITHWIMPKSLYINDAFSKQAKKAHFNQNLRIMAYPYINVFWSEPTFRVVMSYETRFVISGESNNRGYGSLVCALGTKEDYNASLG